MSCSLKNLSKDELNDLSLKAKLARASILKMTTLAGSGHPGGSLSTIDFLLTLYHMIRFDVTNPTWEMRDRVIFSHGHVSPAAYTALGLMGFFSLDDAISQFRLAGSIFEGHVEPDVPGIEWASGNLGQGLSAACGFALGCKKKKLDNHVFVLMGDGEQQKGQLSEARRFAVKYNLNNIIGFIDYNQLQIGGDIKKIMPQNIKENCLSDGWEVIEIDGHNYQEIYDSLQQAVISSKPVLILANTVMGKGISFMENKAGFHGSTLSEDDLSKALEELGMENDLSKYKIMRENFVPSKNSVPKKTDFSFDVKPIFKYEDKIDNRSAWGNAIADIASKLIEKNRHQIIVLDNDLQGSVKTNKFESILPENYIECGIMEHHTATMAGALSKEGFQVFFPGFGVFGVDETYNQHRLNDINKTSVKIITTHVGLDVGEDGKTHQCIDYVGITKNLFDTKIIIPADGNQTDHVTRYIVNKYGNYLVSMGRSKYEPIRKIDGSIFYDENYQFVYGKADLLREGDRAALLVMGTFTSNAIKVYELLKEKGIKISVWHIASPTDIDEEMISQAVNNGYIFTYEDHNVHTGLGNAVAEKMVEMQKMCPLHKFGVEKYAMSGKSSDIFRLCKLDAVSVANKIAEKL